MFIRTMQTTQVELGGLLTQVERNLAAEKRSKGRMGWRNLISLCGRRERKIKVNMQGSMTSLGDLGRSSMTRMRRGPRIGMRACVKYQYGGWVP